MLCFYYWVCLIRVWYCDLFVMFWLYYWVNGWLLVESSLILVGFVVLWIVVMVFVMLLMVWVIELLILFVILIVFVSSLLVIVWCLLVFCFLRVDSSLGVCLMRLLFMGFVSMIFYLRLMVDCVDEVNLSFICIVWYVWGVIW